MSDSPSILVGLDDGQAFIQVQGKGSFQNAPSLKEFTKKMLARGLRSFTIDLGGCSAMDSTFMGTLAGIALRLKELGGGNLQVVNITERNSQSLNNLGLDALFDISQEKPAVSATMEAVETKPATAEAMLEAHQNLIDANPKNLTLFKDVLEFLKSDIDGG